MVNSVNLLFDAILISVKVFVYNNGKGLPVMLKHSCISRENPV